MMNFGQKHGRTTFLSIILVIDGWEWKLFFKSMKIFIIHQKILANHF